MDKYIDSKKVSTIKNIFQELEGEFQTWESEVLRNFNAVSGYYYDKESLAYLEENERSAFTINTVAPLVTRLAGVIRNNPINIEAKPRPDGTSLGANYDRAKMMTTLLQYVMRTENDIDSTVARGYLNAIIGRIGWLATEWVLKDGEYHIEISCLDPFSVRFDTKFRKRDGSDMRFWSYHKFMTIQQIQSIFAEDNPDLYDVLEEEATKVLGVNPDTHKIDNYSDTIRGIHETYSGTRDIDKKVIESRYYNESRKTFLVIEFHDRRIEKRITIYDAATNQTIDVTKEVMVDGKRDDKKLNKIRNNFEMPYTKEYATTINYTTVIVPQLNIVLYDEPDKINQCKIIPIFSLDYHPDIMHMKSIVDQILDPAIAINKSLNTVLEKQAKTRKGTVVVEKGAMETDELERFKNNQTGGVFEAKDINGIRDFSSTAEIGSDLTIKDQLLDLIKFSSGVSDNAMGIAQSADESGVAVQTRIMQTDVMQQYIMDNVNYAILTLGKKLIPMIQTYMTEEQVLRIVDEDGNDQQLAINIQTMQGILNDVTIGKYDIELSRAPYGRVARDQEFQKLLAIVNIFRDPQLTLKMAPSIIKSADTAYQTELLQAMAEIQQEAQQQVPQPDPSAQLKFQTQALKSNAEIQKANLDLDKKKMDILHSHIKNQNAVNQFKDQNAIQEYAKAYT